MLNAEHMERLSDRSVLDRTGHCVVRRQDGGWLVYNRSTDELHLLGPTGHRLYELCDGVQPIGTILSALASVLSSNTQETREEMRGYLAGLMKRGLVYLVEDAEDASDHEAS